MFPEPLIYIFFSNKGKDKRTPAHGGNLKAVLCRELQWICKSDVFVSEDSPQGTSQLQ